ncbi:hypothetical protein DPMN_010727 [Dreissena polymorpha]|uniref:TIR domain-containing protein n=1 Tax=Dreissena polymorpha TaxID=45954 RepID=A0A9D4N3P6_DREPO|nr:hypothetical protein DPMN_010727 [Dreissena polymorpha]
MATEDQTGSSKMYSLIWIALIEILISTTTCWCFVRTDVDIAGYTKWNGTGGIHGYLYCDDKCLTPDSELHCCACNSKTCWDIAAENPSIKCGVSRSDCDIERRLLTQSSVVCKVDSAHDNVTVYRLQNKSGRLLVLPENMCAQSNKLIYIDLSENYLSKIDAIKCMRNLDYLNISNNLIIHIANSTFTNMNYLRILDLHGNPILKLEPNTLSIKHGNILNIDLSGINFESIHLRDMHRIGTYCQIDLTKCAFTSISSDNFVFNESTVYGPGHLLLRNSTGFSFINYTAAGISDLTKLGKIFSEIYSVNSGYNCDCSLVPILKFAKDWFILMTDLMNSNMFCVDPANLRGTLIFDLVQSGDYSKMTCNLVDCPHPPDPNCDTESCQGRPACICTDNQVRATVVVNCSNLKEMPAFVPYGYWGNVNIELTVENGSIQLANPTDYLSRVTKLLFVNTTVIEMHPSFVGRLKSDIEMQFSQQEITELPIEFYFLDPNKINFRKSPVKCNCGNIWIGEWIRSRGREKQLFCKTERGVYDAFHVTEELLNCSNENTNIVTRSATIATGIIACFTLLIGILGFYYRYEIFILKRSLSKNRTNNEHKFQFDVFMSYSSINSYVSKLIEHEVRPMFSQSNFTVFSTSFNIPFGDDLESSILNAIDVSRMFVVFVCDTYQTDLRSVIEFNGIWACFKNHPDRQIIIVNVNSYESNRMHDRRIKAFVRLGFDLNFTERNSKLVQRLQSRIINGIEKHKNRVFARSTVHLMTST